MLSSARDTENSAAARAGARKDGAGAPAAAQAAKGRAETPGGARPAPDEHAAAGTRGRQPLTDCTNSRAPRGTPLAPARLGESAATPGDAHGAYARPHAVEARAGAAGGRAAGTPLAQPPVCASAGEPRLPEKEGASDGENAVAQLRPGAIAAETPGALPAQTPSRAGGRLSLAAAAAATASVSRTASPQSLSSSWYAVPSSCDDDVPLAVAEESARALEVESLRNALRETMDENHRLHGIAGQLRADNAELRRQLRSASAVAMLYHAAKADVEALTARISALEAALADARPSGRVPARGPPL